MKWAIQKCSRFCLLTAFDGKTSVDAHIFIFLFCMLKFSYYQLFSNDADAFGSNFLTEQEMCFVINKYLTADEKKKTINLFEEKNSYEFTK